MSAILKTVNFILWAKTDHQGLGYIFKTTYWLLCEKKKSLRWSHETKVRDSSEERYLWPDPGGSNGMDDNRQKWIISNEYVASGSG